MHQVHVAQAQHHKGPRRVVRQAAVAHLGEAELPLDHCKTCSAPEHIVDSVGGHGSGLLFHKLLTHNAHVLSISFSVALDQDDTHSGAAPRTAAASHPHEFNHVPGPVEGTNT